MADTSYCKQAHKEATLFICFWNFKKCFHFMKFRSKILFYARQSGRGSILIFRSCLGMLTKYPFAVKSFEDKMEIALNTAVQYNNEIGTYE
jgi:hypothetical protein